MKEWFSALEHFLCDVIYSNIYLTTHVRSGSVMYHKIAIQWLMGNQWLVSVKSVVLKSPCYTSGIITSGILVYSVWKKSNFECV